MELDFLFLSENKTFGWGLCASGHHFSRWPSHRKSAVGSIPIYINTYVYLCRLLVMYIYNYGRWGVISLCIHNRASCLVYTCSKSSSSLCAVEDGVWLVNGEEDGGL